MQSGWLTQFSLFDFLVNFRSKIVRKKHDASPSYATHESNATSNSYPSYVEYVPAPTAPYEYIDNTATT